MRAICATIQNPLYVKVRFGILFNDGDDNKTQSSGMLHLKGIALPIPCHVPVAEATAHMNTARRLELLGESTIIVGRVTERKAIRKALKRLLVGDEGEISRAILFKGDAGMGKSSLLKYAALTLQRMKQKVETTNASPMSPRISSRADLVFRSAMDANGGKVERRGRLSRISSLDTLNTNTDMSTNGGRFRRSSACSNVSSRGSGDIPTLSSTVSSSEFSVPSSENGGSATTTILVAAGSSALVNTPYLVMRSLMRQVIDRAGGLTAAMLLIEGDDVDAGLLCWLMEGGDKSNHNRFYGGGGGGSGGYVPVGRLVSEGHVTNKLARLCASLIVALSPACIILDDAQWMDAGSWALCTQLASRCPNCLLLLGSRRNMAADIAFSTFAATPNLKIFDVGPLPQDEASALVQHLYPALGLNDQVLGAVLRVAGGTPMFLREMVRKA